MNNQRGLRILQALFFVNLAVISWQEIKSPQSPIGWPRPSRFVGLGIAFSLLAVFSEIVSAELAAVIGAGLTIGLAINVVQNPEGSSGQGTTVSATQPVSGTGLTGTLQV
jgi:hypothetical protein